MTAINDYVDVLKDASKATDHKQEVGDTFNEVSKRWVNIVHEAMHKAETAGWKEYYIWILISKDSNAVNTLKITPFVRKTRPTPYQAFDHFLYKVDGNKFSYEWSVPSLATSEYVLAYPSKFPHEYVQMLQKWRAGTLY